MGTVEIRDGQLLIHSHFITYGHAADSLYTERIREETETMWNEPGATVQVHRSVFAVVFRISAEIRPGITDLEIFQNTNPRNNYFRIEEFAWGNISFVDGLGCNSGYFKTENLYAGSTTAAHEYGHTLGLEHPDHLDIRGKGVPGIMYPRGTWVDPQYQYEPDKPAGTKGGTLHPKYRKVLMDDIRALRLHKLDYDSGRAVIGEFTNIWHPDHASIDPGSFNPPA